jgi:EmrB/QacA subfamily drug resistance transporter
MRDFIQRTVFGPNHRWWALSVVIVAVFIATTDVGLLTISLPVIITEFRTDITFAGWIVFIYALVTGALYLPSGRLSDLIGRKKTFSAGFLIYGIGSVLAGISHGPSQLIGFRVLQAVGSALMMTNTFALTASLFTDRERGRAMGLSGGLVSALGFTLGPVIGGFITYTLGWRFVFFVSATLSFIGFVAARFLLTEKAPVQPTVREPFDFIGAGAFALGLSFLLLGITTGKSGVLGYWGFLLTVFFWGFFIWWEAHSRHPILDLELFRIVPFAAGNIARLATFIAISTNELMMPFFLQFTLRMDPLEAGSLMTSTALALAVFSPLSGWVSDRLGTTIPAAAGAVVVTAALFAMSLLGRDSGPIEIIPRLALLGIGIGLFQTPNNNSLISSVPPNRLGVASSFISIVRSVGRSVGTAMATAIVSARLLAVTNESAPEDLTALKILDDPELLSAFMHGYRYAYTAAACLGVVALTASLIRGRRA